MFRRVPTRKRPQRTPLEIRHQAALKLVAAAELDGVVALSLVVWPRSPRLESVPVGRQFYSEDLREEIRARHAAGESIPELALKTGVPFGQVKFICSTEGTKREPAELTVF
jgi:hypothetical protein